MQNAIERQSIINERAHKHTVFNVRWQVDLLLLSVKFSVDIQAWLKGLCFMWESVL